MRPVSASNQIRVLKAVLCSLKLVGVYTKRHNLISVITLLSISLISLLMFLEFALTFNGIETLKRVKLFPGIFISGIKGFFMVVNNHKLITLVGMLPAFWRPEAYGDASVEKMVVLNKRLTLVITTYVVVCVLLCGGFMIKPFLGTDDEEVMLVVSDYTYCDIRLAACWWPMYVWQSYALTFQIVPVAIGFDALFIIMTGYIYVACEVFAVGISRMNDENPVVRKYYLRAAVDQHDVILRFVNLLDDTFSIVMLLQFWCSLWSMILFLNMIIADGLPPKFDDATFYGAIYLVFVFQIFLYAYGGAIIEEALRSVSTNIYFGVTWFERERTILRKDLALMIFRAQNAIVLSVGKMSDLNLILWIATMKNSLSVFTLIWQVSNNGAGGFSLP